MNVYGQFQTNIHFEKEGLVAGKHQSYVKGHFNSAWVSTPRGIGKILNRKWRRRTDSDHLKYLSTKNLSRPKPSRQFSFSALQSLHIFPFNSKSPNAWPEVWAASSLLQQLPYVSVPCTAEGRLESWAGSELGKVGVALNHCNVWLLALKCLKRLYEEPPRFL